MRGKGISILEVYIIIIATETSRRRERENVVYSIFHIYIYRACARPRVLINIRRFTETFPKSNKTLAPTHVRIYIQFVLTFLSSLNSKTTRIELFRSHVRPSALVPGYNIICVAKIPFPSHAAARNDLIKFVFIPRPLFFSPFAGLFPAYFLHLPPLLPVHRSIELFH